MDILLRMFAQDYLAGDRSLDALQQRIMDITWDQVVQVSGDTLEAATALELRIAEFTGGHISESVLKDLVREILGLNASMIVLGAPGVTAQAPTWRSAPETLTRKVAIA